MIIKHFLLRIIFRITCLESLKDRLKKKVDKPFGISEVKYYKEYFFLLQFYY